MPCQPFKALFPSVPPVYAMPSSFVQWYLVVPIGVADSEDLNIPSQGIIGERLQNSEIWAKLSKHLFYLLDKQWRDIIQLVEAFPNLVPDVPS